MKFLPFLATLGLAVLRAQPAQPTTPVLPDLPETAVIATFPEDGSQMTVGELRKLYPVLPPPLQQAVNKDPKEFFREYAVIRRMTKLAEEKQIDKASPYAESLMLNRELFLYRAMLDWALHNAAVEPAEIVNYYGAHKDQYKQVKVKAIYIPFSDAAKEAEASEKAKKVVAEARGGADFVKLVKEYSEDDTSKAKDGDFATIHPKDTVPQTVRDAVFALKEGGITDPVRQEHGFYIFRAENIGYRPLSEVRDEIFSALQQEKAREWVQKIDREAKVEFPNPTYPAAAAGSK